MKSSNTGKKEQPSSREVSMICSKWAKHVSRRDIILFPSTIIRVMNRLFLLSFVPTTHGYIRSSQTFAQTKHRTINNLFFFILLAKNSQTPHPPPPPLPFNIPSFMFVLRVIMAKRVMLRCKV